MSKLEQIIIELIYFVNKINAIKLLVEADKT